MKIIFRYLTHNLVIFTIIDSFTVVLPSVTSLDLVTIACVYTCIETIINPILHTLIAPFNAITFGFLKWIPAVISLYLLTLTLEVVSINPLTIPNFNFGFLKLPTIHFGTIGTYFFLSFCLTYGKKFFTYISR